MAPCPCLANEQVFYICKDCSGTLCCRKCIANDHKGHTVRTLTDINNIMRPFVQAFELQSQQYNVMRSQLMMSKRTQFFQELDAANQHFKGVLQNQLQIKKIAWFVKMGQLMVQHSYDYVRLLQFIANPQQVQGQILKVNAELVMYRKKVESIKLRVVGINPTASKMALNPTEQNILRMKDQYLRYQNSIRVPPKSACRKCSVNCCAKYKACLKLCNYYFTCKCLKCKCFKCCQNDCSGKRCCGWIVCCPCKSLGACSKYSGFYCDDPFLLFMCCNRNCDCRLLDLDKHPCPCCICCDGICDILCCTDGGCDYCCQCGCCDDFCQLFCGCMDCFCEGLFNACDAVCNCFCDTFCQPFCNCMQGCCEIFGQCCESVCCICEPFCSCLQSCCDILSCICDVC